jgi:hypothetical protein
MKDDRHSLNLIAPDQLKVWGTLVGATLLFLFSTASSDWLFFIDIVFFVGLFMFIAGRLTDPKDVTNPKLKVAARYKFFVTMQKEPLLNLAAAFNGKASR